MAMHLSGVGRRTVAVMAAACIALVAVGTANAGVAPRAGIVRGTVTSGTGARAVPLGGASITLFRSTEVGVRTVSTARTDAAGRFAIADASGTSHRYLVARSGDRRVLVTVLGTARPKNVAINELTTVAAAYATAQLASGTAISGTKLQLTAAAGMAANVVSPATGRASATITSPPNGNETNAWRSLGTLANILVPCTRNGDCAELLALTKAGSRGTTWSAAQQIARNPARNLKALFALSNRRHVFTPYLTAKFGPAARSKWTRLDALTLAVKVNASGSTTKGKEDCPFGGPGNLVFDLDGNAWITNNVVQGTPDSTNCIIVLRPNGKPAKGENGGPTSPVTGGGIVGQGFGLGFDPSGRLWSGNFGWGSATSMPTIDGTTPGGGVSVFDSSGKAISGPYGYAGSMYRVQGTVSDVNGNIWMASYGNSKVQVFPGGDPTTTFPAYTDDTNTEPFDIRLDPNGDAWVSYTGTSKALKLRYTASGVQKLATVSTGTKGDPKGVAVDQDGNVWVASGANNLVYAFDTSGAPLGSFDGGGMNGPWGVTVDSSGSLWAANFGGVTQVDTKYGVTHLCGFTATACPAGKDPGDPLTPKTGFTLPSGGAPVTLRSGQPLYGPVGPKTYKPLMRETAAEVDAAGNLWVTNNWKPSGAIDTAGGNPGGDGIVIFLGVAAPVQPKLYSGPANAPAE